MRNTIIILAIILHVGALYWSCAQPKKLVYSEPRSGEVLENIKVEKSITNNYIISWTTDEAETEVEVYTGTEEEGLNSTKLIESTRTQQIKVKKNKTVSDSYFQLVVPGKDTVTIPQAAVSPQ